MLQYIDIIKIKIVRELLLYLCDSIEGENIEEKQLVNKSLPALASFVQSLSVKNE